MDICEDILPMTPEGTWNPHNDAFGQNEANMLDYEGNMINNKDHVKIILEEVVLDEALGASMMISEVEPQHVDKIVESAIPVEESDTDDIPVYENVLIEFNDVKTNICSVNGIYDAEVMCSK